MWPVFDEDLFPAEFLAQAMASGHWDHIRQYWVQGPHLILIDRYFQEDGTWTDIPRCIEHDPGVEEQVRFVLLL